MRIAIIGAGAIGGLLGVRLATAGHHVRLIARGTHLEAIRANGLTLIDENGERQTARIEADLTIARGGWDAIMLCVKAHQLADIAPQVVAATDEHTTIVTTQNGIPWWYFHKHGGPLEGARLESVDPGGVISRVLPVDRIVASIAYPAAEIVSPGVIRHIEGRRFPVGELDGGDSERARALSSALRDAGFKAPVLSDIRSELWTKLWGNLSFNPISALTRATLADICRFQPTRDLATVMMREAQAVAEHFGIRFRIPLERRLAGAEAVGAHKTSMLQDIEGGRPIEADAMIGAVAELGRLAGVATPAIDAVFGLTSLLSRSISPAEAPRASLPIPDTLDA